MEQRGGGGLMGARDAVGGGPRVARMRLPVLLDCGGLVLDLKHNCIVGSNPTWVTNACF